MPTFSSFCLLFSGATVVVQVTSQRSKCLGPNIRNFCPIGRNETAKTRYFIEPYEDRFNEVSYMVHSPQTWGEDEHPVVWVGSDREQMSLSAVDLVTGLPVCTYVLKNVPKEGDWESISLGPCSHKETDKRTCVYVANTGNNDAHDCIVRNCEEGRDEVGRDEVKVYKFPEPNLVQCDGIKEIDVVTINLNYHDEGFPSNRADCEAVFVDYKGDRRGGRRGDMYLVTKFPDSRELQRVGKVPAKVHASLQPGESATFSILPVGNPLPLKQWTGGDMSLDGKMIALRDYRRIHFFPRPYYLSVGDALSIHACDFLAETTRGGNESQHEAVAWFGDDIGEASECKDKSSCRVAVTIHELNFLSEPTVGSSGRRTRLSDGGYLYQAEDFSSQYDTESDTRHDNFHGDGYVNFGGDRSYVEWDFVSVRRGGYFKLAFRYASNDDEGRPCKVYVNGRKLQVFDAPFEDTGGWDAWQMQVLNNVKLCPGKNTIRVQSVERGPNLDFMTVERIQAPSLVVSQNID